MAEDITPWGSTPRTSRQRYVFEAAQSYLTKRGFTLEEKDRIKIEIIPISSLAEYVPRVSIRPYHEDSVAIVLPHFDPVGNSYGYASARIIQPEIKIASFRNDTADAPKLLCPGNITPKPHFSLLNPEATTTVYVTESRLKADTIAKCGFYAVGVNGVWGWSHKNSNSKVLTEIWEFPWARVKNVVFVPDSNTDNPNVMSAVVQFAANMRMRGVEVQLLKVPKNAEGEDQGIDDYYAENGKDKCAALLSGVADAIEKDSVTSKKWELNEKVCFIRQISRYAEIDTGHLMTYGDFTKGNYGNWVEYNEEGKPLSIPQIWNAWEGRREVEELAYRPGLSPLVDGQFLNLWKGMGCEPRKGDASPLLEFLGNNIPNPEERKWMIQWFAYPLQNLGAKMATSLIVIGQQGIGKSLLANVVSKIYGPANSVMITREQLDSTFNSIYSAKQFVVVDEMSKNSRRDVALASSNKLKTLVTELRLLVNRKGQPEFEIENHMNIVMTSNHVDALFMEDGDRRFAVIEFSPIIDRRYDHGYWDSFAKWCDDNLGVIYDFLLTYDISDFAPYGRAPETEAKKSMIESSYTDEQQLASALWESPGAILKALGFPEDMKYIVTNRMLDAWWVYNGRNTKPTVSNQTKFGTCLKDLGAEKKQVKIDGQPFRVYKLTTDEWNQDQCKKDLGFFIKKR